jgi:LmbE family N-acetylglucosaminyl deacetylase
MLKTILTVVAHPDDELGAGGVMARYASEGHRVYVVCATRGDGVDAQIKNEAATRETLGQVRQAELACSCATLGVNPPIVLGYQDGEVDQVPLAEAAARMLDVFHQLEPDLVITHDPGGGYGHPDHLAVHRFVTGAFERAGEVLGERAPCKLYYYAFPRSLRNQIPAFRDRRADIRGQQLGFVGVEDKAITAVVDIRPWLAVKVQALACHRSQFEFDDQGEPRTFSTSLPEPERSQIFGFERFILAQTRGVDIRPETDLLD